MKRTKNVMVRLTDEEYESLLAMKPAGEELAAFVRKAALSAAAAPKPEDVARRAAAFTVAALSQEITFEEALALFDAHPVPNNEEVAHGRRDQE